MGSRPMGKYQGSCHCGAVRFEIETDFPELTMCDCSICRRKNALMVKVHESAFTLLAGEDALAEYRFHTMTATAQGVAISSGWLGLAVSSRIIGSIAGGDPKRLKSALMVIPAASVVMIV